MFYGLYIEDETLRPSSADDLHNYLCFGEFQGFENFDHTIVFHFPTLNRDVTVRIVSTAHFKSKDETEWNIDYYVDGTKVTPVPNGILPIVLQ